MPETGRQAASGEPKLKKCEEDDAPSDISVRQEHHTAEEVAVEVGHGFQKTGEAIASGMYPVGRYSV